MPFRIGLTRDFIGADGSSGFGDIGLSLLDDDPGIEWEFLSRDVPEISAEMADSYDGLLVLSPKITSRTVEGCGRLQVIARFGVGYDNVDVQACSRNGVMLTITPDGVRRPERSGR